MDGRPRGPCNMHLCSHPQRDKQYTKAGFAILTGCLCEHQKELIDHTAGGNTEAFLPSVRRGPPSLAISPAASAADDYAGSDAGAAALAGVMRTFFPGASPAVGAAVGQGAVMRGPPGWAGAGGRRRGRRERGALPLGSACRLAQGHPDGRDALCRSTLRLVSESPPSISKSCIILAPQCARGGAVRDCVDKALFASKY